MFHDMPDNPVPGVGRFFFEYPLIPEPFLMRGRGRNKLFQISGSPAVKGGGDHAPALLKHGGKFSCLVHGWLVIVLVIVPVTVGISFTHPEVEPVEARTAHMLEKLADRSLMWSKREGKKFR
jgi:hypothetical protein